MTIDYDIYFNNKLNILRWITSQDSFVEAKDLGEKVTVTMNHTTEEEETEFKQKIADMMFQINIDNTVYENTLEKITAIQTDLPIYTSELVTTKDNIGTEFVNLFNGYGGRSFFADTTGFKKVRYHLFLDTNGSIGTINLRLVDNGNENNVLFDEVVVNGQNQNQITIPESFINFRGRLKLQMKSTVGTDSPKFDGIRIYLIR